MKTKNLSQGETTWHETPRDDSAQAAICRANPLHRNDDRDETQVIDVQGHGSYFVEYVRGIACAHRIFAD